MSLYSRAPSRALLTFTGTLGLVSDGRCMFLNILGGVSASDCSCECEMTSWREKDPTSYVCITHELVNEWVTHVQKSAESCMPGLNHTDT